MTSRWSRGSPGLLPPTITASPAWSWRSSKVCRFKSEEEIRHDHHSQTYFKKDFAQGHGDSHRAADAGCYDTRSLRKRRGENSGPSRICLCAEWRHPERLEPDDCRQGFRVHADNEAPGGVQG